MSASIYFTMLRSLLSRTHSRIWSLRASNVSSSESLLLELAARPGGSRVSYGSYSRPGSAPGNRRDASPRSRRYHDFSEIELESRDEAYLVIDRLGDIIEEYGLATVADLYDLCGITTEYTDENWGWTSARYMSVIRSRRGYMLQLPKPDHINAR